MAGAESPLDEEVSALSASQLQRLRTRFENDLYFCCSGVLGYDQLQPETHAPLCAFIQADQHKRRMSLMPRGHLKTTIATIGDSIRRAAKRPNYERIGIFHATATGAEEILSEIKGHWEHNKLLRALYPALVPTKIQGPGSDWSAYSASLNRTRVYKESTWNASGVGGEKTGSHFTHIKNDDIVGVEAENSPAVLERTNNWIDNQPSLLTNLVDDIIDTVGTRWLAEDTYQHMIDTLGNALTVFSREDIENGQPIFPKKFTLEILAQMERTNPRKYYAQYKNAPLSGGLKEWPEQLLRYWTMDNQGKYRYKKDGEELAWSRDQLSVTVRVDPNAGNEHSPDEFAIWCDGVAPNDDVIALESYNGRPTPTKAIEILFDFCHRNRPRAVGIEKAGQQNTIHYFEQEMLKHGEFYRVVPLPSTKLRGDKTVFIRKSLDPVLRMRRLVLAPYMLVAKHQITNFPHLKNDDVIEALAQGVREDMWRTPWSVEEQEEDEAVVGKILAARNSITGY